MGKLLTKNDIGYENHNFWWFYIMAYRGFDDEEELNLDDAIMEVIDEDSVVPDFSQWMETFCPKDGVDNEGNYENPNVIAGGLTDEMNFAIEFHGWHINYFINDIYIGNIGGHFEAWFLTLEELLTFDKYDYLFMLLLPMTGVEESEREMIEKLICKKLEQIEFFKGHEAYIAQCITNGLVMEDKFEETPDIGLTSNENHCVRNISKYPRYKDDVIALNKVLRNFVKGK